MRFEEGKGYWATNKINGEQVLLVAAERSAGRMTFVKPSGLFSAEVEDFDGREMATVAMPDGWYLLTAATVAPISETAKVIDSMIKK